jgi:AbiV family abortive infection protein
MTELNRTLGNDSTPKLVSKLSEGAVKVLRNAGDLYAEALLLRNAGALSRSLVLHQISIEECAKVDMLGALATSALMGMTVNLTAFARAFRSHKAKNHTNAYLLPAGAQELAARDEKRWDDALRAFEEQQRTLHEDSNSAKNAGLYVSMDDDAVFSAPTERVSPDMIEAIATRNEHFLAHAHAMEHLLKWLASNPAAARQFFAEVNMMVPNRTHFEDMSEVMASLMEKVRAYANDPRYAGVARGAFPASPAR